MKKQASHNPIEQLCLGTACSQNSDLSLDSTSLASKHSFSPLGFTLFIKSPTSHPLRRFPVSHLLWGRAFGIQRPCETFRLRAALSRRTLVPIELCRTEPLSWQTGSSQSPCLCQTT